MSTPLYDGPDRRRTVQDKFEEAVEIAAQRAAQRVARMHRMRLVRWTFMASLLVSLASILILWFAWIGPQEREFARANAVYDCQLFRDNANVMADFIQTDANLRLQEEKLGQKAEFLQGERKLFGDKALKDAIRKSHQIDYQAIHHWRTIDIPKLQQNGSVDCVKNLSAN